ncbi:MAG: glycosyltransferase [Chlorobiaceae bacterium]|jgi:glycosyltransferase involved in cell wall biosynthesis|nr:glycosyltransferase [Chlorobiaceae bacterium]
MKRNDTINCSLVITTYNRPEALELSIRSALSQSVPPFEIIIADDGSTCETAFLIDNLSPLSHVPLIHVWQEDLGFRAAASRNRAIAETKGNYIVIIDGDMLLDTDFIRDHRSMALEGSFIQGSRVLLSRENSDMRLETKVTDVSPFEKGLGNRKNTLRLPWLSGRLAIKNRSLSGIRSCNMSFFRKDCILINGFNEDFVGWGREDSEFAVRMMNKGILRRNVKFSAIAYHLWHPENSRKQLAENDRLLERAIDEHVTFCRNGIDKYLNQ